jgi:hypothetical protein
MSARVPIITISLKQKYPSRDTLSLTQVADTAVYLDGVT